MIVPYKNSLVVSTHFNVSRDEYILYDQNDDIVDILPRHQFLSYPHLRRLYGVR